MKTFILRIYADVRVVVRQRGAEWQVCGQKFYDESGWTDWGDVVFKSTDRTFAMVAALRFSEKFIKNAEGSWVREKIDDVLGGVR